MDYVKPVDVASAMVETGRRKLDLSPVDLLIRGALAGSILAAATSLAITGAVQTGQPLVGALIFPGRLDPHRACSGSIWSPALSAWCRCPGWSATPARRTCSRISAGYSSAT